MTTMAAASYYGYCGGNTSSFDAKGNRPRPTRKRLTLARVAAGATESESGADPGLRACRRHRLMLASQHSACADYVTDNLAKALACGAIPIVQTVGGRPSYRGLAATLGMRHEWQLIPGATANEDLTADVGTLVAMAERMCSGA